MPHLYPLRLHPEFYERVWGSRSLAPIYSQEITGTPIGEAWLTSDTCKVANGPLSGMSLGELSRQFGRDLLGDVPPDHSRFPLLIKFLFPKDKLSVQVHPDDSTAARIGDPCGKTECWYVLRAEPGAQVGLGLKPGTSKTKVKQAIRASRMEQLLNWVDLHQGDLIYVDAGTVHTIGPGSVLVEIQQNSDTTFRLYDYGRPRELHIEAGMNATKEWTHAGKVERRQTLSADGKSQANLITAPCFIVDKFKLLSPWEFRRPPGARQSVWCLVAISGSGVISAGGSEPTSFSRGEVVVVPAAVERFSVKPQWDLPPQNAQQRRAPGTPDVEFLCASIPLDKVGQPKTVLAEIAASVTQ